MAVKPSRVPYLEIAAAIREQIRSGQLGPGDQIKTVRALAAEHSVALGTVGAALEVLRSEGLIDTVQGRGSVVIAIPADAESGTALESAVRDAEARLAERYDGELAALRAELRELAQRGDVARIEANLIELYGRTGHDYPLEDQHSDAEQEISERTASRGRGS
jgi:DNA-binding transcriptional regulator YhcF (GntR family)